MAPAKAPVKGAAARSATSAAAAAPAAPAVPQKRPRAGDGAAAAAPQKPAQDVAAAAPAAAPQKQAGLGASSLGDLYSKCVQMVNENKVSTRNAFDLKLIDHMDDIVDSFMGGRKTKAGPASDAAPGKAPVRTSKVPDAAEVDVEEHRFHEASCTIEASARIYACRVDCVHTDTYRVLGGLNSADMDEEEGKDGEEGKTAKKRRIIGVNTLEKNEKNIVQQHIEADEQSDPMFRRMAAAFDAGGAKGLLLSHLPIAEDLSLVFNGDVPLSRAASTAKPIFSDAKSFRPQEIGLGPDTSAAAARIGAARLCTEIDSFRRQLWGNVEMDVALPDQLTALLCPAVATGVATAPDQPALFGAADDLPAFGDGDCGGGDDSLVPDQNSDMPFCGASGAGGSNAPFSGASGAPGAGAQMLPLLDMELPAPGALTAGKTTDDVIHFDELFEKFCGGAAASQFAYFDECWARLNSKDKTPGPAEPGADDQIGGEIADGFFGGDGALVAATPDARGKRQMKRPIFDLSGLGEPIRPIETEPSHKHQLSDKAVQWQLHKDVPPYMIDRITMPSWPSWSKCDFACLGLRPHLMLKLVRKPQPEGDGPHSFSDLFSTVVVENPDAFPWLAMDSKIGGGDGDELPGAGGFDGAEEGDFDGAGLPAHLDVDPQELFLRPDDKVVPGCDDEDLLPAADDDGGFGTGLDFDLVEQPTTVGSTDIAYSRNSKFVDVKMVKKHLWDCINSDIANLPDQETKTATSFQELVHRTVDRMPKAECENLSIQVCFICALHLCNEKGIELKADASLADFAVVGSQKMSSSVN